MVILYSANKKLEFVYILHLMVMPREVMEKQKNQLTNHFIV